MLYVYPFRNFKLPESASFKLVPVCVGGCPISVFFLVTNTHTHTDPFLFILVFFFFFLLLTYL